MGPFYLFSTISPLVGFNPVIEGEFNMNIQINKTMGFDPKNGDMVTDTGELGSNFKIIESSLPYRFYHLTSPFLKEFDEVMWKNNKYSNKTETRDF